MIGKVAVRWLPDGRLVVQESHPIAWTIYLVVAAVLAIPLGMVLLMTGLAAANGEGSAVFGGSVIAGIAVLPLLIVGLGVLPWHRRVIIDGAARRVTLQRRWFRWATHDTTLDSVELLHGWMDRPKEGAGWWVWVLTLALAPVGGLGLLVAIVDGQIRRQRRAANPMVSTLAARGRPYGMAHVMGFARPADAEAVLATAVQTGLLRDLRPAADPRQSADCREIAATLAQRMDPPPGAEPAMTRRIREARRRAEQRAAAVAAAEADSPTQPAKLARPGSDAAPSPATPTQEQDVMSTGNAVIGQSGGPTAVINQSLVGVVEGLRQGGFGGKILGAHHAVSGIVKGDFIDLTDTPQDKLDLIAGTPSSALGSSRDKPDQAYCERIFDAFEKHDVRYFFYIGGNDSSDTCRIVAEMGRDKGYELHAVHVPKTVDNDLMENDHTPGWGSAARFVASAFVGDDFDNAALPGIKIDVVMGRHAGFLTAAAMLGRDAAAGAGPHLIYVPEADFDLDSFRADVERVYREKGRCLIAVSEGIHDKDGNPMAAKLAESVEKDAHGNVQLSGSGALGDHLADVVKNHFAEKGEKVRVRADTFGYLQRSFLGCVSEADQTEAREAGRQAATHALGGAQMGSIAIKRVSDSPYKVDYELIDIAKVAAKTRHLDPKYIKDGNDIDESFKAYALPIIGELPAYGRF